MNDRARQFMPFAALRGYEELIRECEKIKEPEKIFLEYDEERSEIQAKQGNNKEKYGLEYIC